MSEDQSWDEPVSNLKAIPDDSVEEEETGPGDRPENGGEIEAVDGYEIAYALGEVETSSPRDPGLGPESVPEPIHLRDRVASSPLSPQLRLRVEGLPK